MAPPSVMDKTKVPPSGDKHDYLSLGTYWWPNPDAPDGLPYVRRDGHRNPECAQLDSPRMRAMVQACTTLSLAWYLVGDDRYGSHAANLFRVWFLDEATRMNPHLEYGQAIPGICDGRDIGIIDTAHAFGDLIDAIGLIGTFGGWTAADTDGMQAWMAAYLQWLIDSPHGAGEAAQHNNHGTWFDAQMMALALYVDRRDVAASVAAAFGDRRLATQIEPDGTQPYELARTQSMGYTAMNTVGFQQAAALAAHVGVDLWNYQTPDGRGLRRALEWFAPFVTGEAEWTHEQVHPVEPGPLVGLYRQAACAYQDDTFERVAQSVPGLWYREHRVNLTRPWRG